MWEKTQSFDNSHSSFYDFANFVYEDKFYVVGGRVNNKTKASIIKFDPDDGKWSEVGRLKHARNGHKIAVINSTVYVVGGNQNSESCTLSKTTKNGTVYDKIKCETIKSTKEFIEDENPVLYGHNLKQCKPGNNLLIIFNSR